MELKAPYLGVAYYPEDWDECEIDKDIKRMKEIGINCARIGEFAWHRMEPKIGEFDFSFFKMVVDKLYAAGIAVVMGTPTATPPIWLSRKYPDVFSESKDGQRSYHGGRRHCCSNNPHYIEYSLRIVEEQAKAFADHPGIVGWQIDNEIYAFGGGCFCPECVAKFHDYLRNKYGSIDNLNKAWNLNLFSQWYDDFEEIPEPRRAWHNPHIKLEWETFQSESQVQFVHRQADILHKYVRVPVGTDTMPFNGIDYRKMTDKLDIVQFNHYNTPDNLHCCAFWFDYLRMFKEHPFWNTETATNWNGSVEMPQSIKPEGYCVANSWLPIVLGGEANMYWLWRTHWAGHELTHGAVIDSTGRDMHTVGEVMKTADGFKKAAEFINGTKVITDVAIHYTSLNWRMHETQKVVWDMPYTEHVTDKLYKPLTMQGVRPDIIDAVEELDRYKLIFSPQMMTIDEAGLPERMEQWVKNGGTWVAGPLTDVRNSIGARYTDSLYGMLEKLTGIHWCYGIPDREGNIKAQWSDGTAFSGSWWYELSDENDNEALVKVTEGHSAIVGKAVVIKCRVGKGNVILVGSVPSAEDGDKLIRLALETAGIETPQITGSLMLAKRSGTAGDGWMMVNIGNTAASIKLNKEMQDVIGGGTVKDTLTVEPYGVRVLKYE